MGYVKICSTEKKKKKELARDPPEVSSTAHFVLSMGHRAAAINSLICLSILPGSVYLAEDDNTFFKFKDCLSQLILFLNGCAMSSLIRDQEDNFQY